ncbi:hypothetical protein [Methylorubrum aminovorans]
MTAQMPDRILIDGSYETLKFWGWPFPPEVDLPDGWHFGGGTTATQRGYSSTWEASGGRLYLRDFGGTLVHWGSGQQRMIKKEDLLPGSGPTFAHWVSSIFKVALGERVGYSHSGYGYHYDRYRILDIQAGVIVRDEIKLNDIISDEQKNMYRSTGGPW